MPILQINFKLNVPAEHYVSGARGVAGAIGDVPGLRWKIWLLNEKEQEAGGIYCFETTAAMNEYVGGPIVGQLRNLPAISDLNIKNFEAIEELTKITRGPVLVESGAR